MTEGEWLTSVDPEAMYRVVARGAFRTGYKYSGSTARKRSFFGAACCRLVWPLIEPDPRCRRAVERLESQFDEPIDEDEEEDIWDDIKTAARHPADGTPGFQLVAANLVYDSDDPLTAVRYLLRSLDEWGDVKGRAAQIAGVMRCIVGNPFRSVTIDADWRTPAVVALAEGVYADRAWDRLPILADALDDAGCTDPAVLDHLRGPGPHARGCSVVDLILGKA